jgi:hypothetical protein
MTAFNGLNEMREHYAELIKNLREETLHRKFSTVLEERLMAADAIEELLERIYDAMNILGEKK